MLIFRDSRIFRGSLFAYLQLTPQFLPITPKTVHSISAYGIIILSRFRAHAQKSSKGGDSVHTDNTTFEMQNMDSLTGLYNAKQMAKDLERHIMNEQNGYLMVMGIDNIKNINHKYGRAYGDQILQGVAELLKQATRGLYCCYRVGSDKFAIIVPVENKEIVETIYEELHSQNILHCTISSGVAAYSGSAQEDTDTIYMHAESALDRAKRQGKNTQMFFSKEMYEKRLNMIALQEELQESVKQDFAGFTLNYQPQISCGAYKIFGAEALLRYESPTRGMVRPDEFIPILEETDLILEVGKWILRTALAQCKKWREFLPTLQVSVNVSYVQLQEADFGDYVLQLLKEIDISGDALTLELTESMHLQDYTFFNKLIYKLRNHGIQVAIDDFGTGYSSLSYLQNIEVDEIKIDRCFVSRIQYNTYNRKLVANMIDFAHSARIRVCCEGIEDEEELAVLKALHPDLLQGYLFAKPYTPELFEKYYIDHTCKEYHKCRQNEKYYISLNGNEDNEEKKNLAQMRLGGIVDSMEEMIYLTHIDDLSLVYLNAKGRELTGCYDYRGRKCYEVLRGCDRPCENCPNLKEHSDEYHVWEAENDYMQKHFLVKEKLISWMGERVRLSIAIDITEKEIMSKKLQKKLELVEKQHHKDVEYLRQKDFYKAVLSETIAYAEIDLEEKRILSMDGLWSPYVNEKTRVEKTYEEILTQYKTLLLHPDDVKKFEQFIKEGALRSILGKPNDTDTVQFRRLIDDEMRWVEMTGHVFQDEYSDKTYALLYMKDIDMKKKRELERELAATRDPLTKVFNRKAFEEEVIKHVLSTQLDHAGALVIVDLDNFKMINDKFGHAEGDKVLLQLADVLMTTFRRKDIIGRLGGDEFLIFLKNLSKKDIVNRRLEELRSALEKVAEHNTTCSIGVTFVNREGFSYGDSLRMADAALYKSKEKGRNAYSYYDEV